MKDRSKYWWFWGMLAALGLVLCTINPGMAQERAKVPPQELPEKPGKEKGDEKAKKTQPKVKEPDEAIPINIPDIKKGAKSKPGQRKLPTDPGY
jgi:hypothetical protein